MDALVMCGGRGTRLSLEGEKPLVGIGGRAMVDRVLDALRASGVEHTYAVVSPNAPETRDHLETRGGVSTIATPGKGYVSDLERALQRVGRPVLTVAADLPLLGSDAVDGVLEADGHDGGSMSMTVCTRASLKRELGVSVDTAFNHGGEELAPTGVNIVGEKEEEKEGDERIRLTDDVRLAVNVNRVRDARIAEALLSLGSNDTNPWTV